MRVKRGFPTGGHWRLALYLVAGIAVLSVAAAFTYAWFTGRTTNAGSQLTSGSMDLELLTLSPTRTIAPEDGKVAAPGDPVGVWSYTGAELRKVPIGKFFASGIGLNQKCDIVNMGDHAQSLVKFLEYMEPDKNNADPSASGTVVSGALPNFRQQRPVLVYNPSGGEAIYTLDFVARAGGTGADLRSAFYFNCTPLGMTVKPGEAVFDKNAELTMDIPSALVEGFAGRVPPNHTDPVSGASNIELTPLLPRPDERNGKSIPPIDAKRIEAWEGIATDSGKASALHKVLVSGGSAVSGAIRIQPHCYHIFMVDMGIYPTAGNSYQNAALLLDVVLTAQQPGDTVHRVNDVRELAAAITANAVRAKTNGTAGGDTIVLMQDITVTEPLPAYRVVFNLVLDGHTLTFGEAENGAGEVISFGSLLVEFPDQGSTMDIGSPSGGKIVNADRMNFRAGSGSAPCVLNWYGELCFRTRTDADPTETAIPDPVMAQADTAADLARHPKLASPAPDIFGLGGADSVNADAVAVLPAPIGQIVDSPRILVEQRTIT